VATSRSTRARRFALPDHGDDERTHEAIEAFLEGPEVRQRRPARPRPRRKGYPNTGSDTGAKGTKGKQLAQGEQPSADAKAGADAKPGAVPAAAAAAKNGSGPIASDAMVPSTETRPASVLARSVTDIRTIPGRLEFSLALERESARAARYGRPASVAIVELVPERPNHSGDIWLRSLAGPVARTLRAGSRTTDLVARVANARFQVLLPETPEAGAGRFAERVSSACQGSIDESGAPVSVRVTIAVATPDQSLQEALTDALQAIEAA
jgi:GGDEF domain-containing protein